MKWRIYRLPGSRDWWLIDHGPGSIVLFAKEWKTDEKCMARSESGDPSRTPRAWITVSNSDLYIQNHAALFRGAMVN